MPVRFDPTQNADEKMFAFVLAISGSSLNPIGELRVYSGEWTRVDWARHIYALLWMGGSPGLPGAHGRCFVSQRELTSLPIPISFTCDVCNRNCDVYSGRMKQCSGCRFTRYCSGRCLSVGWYNGHREECGQMQEAFPLVDNCPLTDYSYGYITRYDFELILHLFHSEA